MLEDQEGNLWFGTGWYHIKGKGVSRYDGTTFTTFTIQDGLPDNQVCALLEDRDGRLWFGTHLGGVCYYDGQQFVVFTTQDGLPDNKVFALLEDRQGHLWVGTYGGGVSRYDGNQFTIFTTEDGLANNGVMCLLEDRRGHLWFGTWEGISRYDGTTFTTFTTVGGVLSVIEDRQGHLWFGTDQGVSRYDGKDWASFTPEDGLGVQSVWSILEDRRGHLWFGGEGGAARYDGEKWDTKPSYWVWSILEDRRGHLWFGTGGGGVVRFDGDTFRIFTTEDGLASNTVLTILEDRHGHLWFGTWASGVSRFDGEAFTTFTTEDGLADNMVRSMFEDGQGHLLFGTYGGGVSRFDGQVFQTLSWKDGLVHNSVKGILQDRHGDLWLATEGGVVRYRSHYMPPTIHITDVISDRRYGAIAEINLPVSQSLLGIEFQGNSLTTRPDQMVYVYRLEGYDADWQQMRTNRVEYTDLSIGDYIFQVKAVDRDLNYSEPVAIEVQVHLPYGRLGLWSALTIALLLVVWQTTRVIRRDRRLQQVNTALSSANKELFQVNVELQEANTEIQENTRRMSDFLARMSHDLRTPMNAIIGYTRILLRRLKDSIEPRQLRNLKNIDTSSHNLLNLINEILDLSRVQAGRIDVNPQDIDLKQLATECATSIESLIEPGVELIQRLDDVPVLHTDPDVLRKVLMNLLSNAVKFTEEGSITLSVRPADGGIELAVADTGVGIPAEDLPHIFDEFQQVERQGSTEKEGTGLGLAIARKSVELLGGTLSAKSEVGKGATFTLRIKDYPSE